MSRDGREVYVRPFPGPGSRIQVSNEGGWQPLWALNGKQLFYRSNDNQQVWVVDVRTDLDWAASATKIKGAVRENPEKVDSWMAKYDKGKILVFYCA
jgi:hypothetical protein